MCKLQPIAVTAGYIVIIARVGFQSGAGRGQPTSKLIVGQLLYPHINSSSSAAIWFCLCVAGSSTVSRLVVH